MKEIKAVIQPSRLARLRQAFRAMADFPGMTVSRAEGSGYHPQKPMPANVKSELTESSQRVRVEIIAPEHQVDEVLRIIVDTCHTGRPGDGVVWVTPVQSFLRVREARPAG